MLFRTAHGKLRVCVVSVRDWVRWLREIERGCYSETQMIRKGLGQKNRRLLIPLANLQFVMLG